MTIARAQCCNYSCLDLDFCKADKLLRLILQRRAVSVTGSSRAG